MILYMGDHSRILLNSQHSHMNLFLYFYIYIYIYIYWGPSFKKNACMKLLRYIYLRCFTLEAPTWAKWLPLAQYWYNTSHRSSLGKSPYEALLGPSPPTSFIITQRIQVFKLQIQYLSIFKILRGQTVAPEALKVIELKGSILEDHAPN